MSKKKEIMQNVNNWLEEERYAFGIIYDPQTDLNISISFNEYTGCNVILTKNDSLLLIVTEVTFSEEDKKTFAHFKKESKLVFIQELGYSLSQVNVQYSIYPDSENMDYIQIRYIIYFDGLTNLKPLSNSNDKTGSQFPFHHFLSIFIWRYPINIITIRDKLLRNQQRIYPNLPEPFCLLKEKTDIFDNRKKQFFAAVNIALNHTNLSSIVVESQSHSSWA